jgi:hypothetical protein
METYTFGFKTPMLVQIILDVPVLFFVNAD